MCHGFCLLFAIALFPDNTHLLLIRKFELFSWVRFALLAVIFDLERIIATAKFEIVTTKS